MLVDINWRPVFWESLSHKAVQIVSEYAGGADILKLSEEEAEWLYGVHPDQAMTQPELVSLQGLFPDLQLGAVPRKSMTCKTLSQNCITQIHCQCSRAWPTSVWVSNKDHCQELSEAAVAHWIICMCAMLSSLELAS